MCVWAHATTDDGDFDLLVETAVVSRASLSFFFLVVFGVLTPTRRSRAVVLLMTMDYDGASRCGETKTVRRFTSHVFVLVVYSPLDTTNDDDDDCETPPKAICSIGYFVSSMLLVASSAPTCRVLLLAPRRRRRLSTPGHHHHRVLSNRKCRRHRSSSNEDVGHQKNRNENTKAGTLKRREVMETKDRRKLDERDDALWYARPRFCAHVDDGFLEQLTRLYRQRTTPEFACLDLCASHVSHYPYAYAYVLGHGLNREELERNDQFRRGMNTFFVRNFNEHPVVDAPDRTFDMVSMCVSIQYMQRGEELFREIFRVLKPGGVAIISYSNRMFYEKAVSVWRDGTGYSRTQLVKSYFQNVNGFTEPEVITEVLPDGIEDKKGNPFVKMMKTFVKRTSSDPFYAVVSYRNFKRVQ